MSGNASSSSDDKSVSPKSRTWKFTILNPDARPFVEGSLRHIAYDIHEDRISGVLLYREAVRRPLKTWESVMCEPIPAKEFHALCANAGRHEGDAVTDNSSNMMRAAGIHAQYIRDAREGRLPDKFTERQRSYYQRYFDKAERERTQGNKCAPPMLDEPVLPTRPSVADVVHWYDPNTWQITVNGGSNNIGCTINNVPPKVTE